MVRRASDLKLDGIVITEHDWIWTEPELDELRSIASGLLVFAGVEVSAREGHFLVYGIDDSLAVPRGIGLSDLCRKVHDRGGAVVAAHPFRWGQPFHEILAELQPDLDGLERMTSNMDAECRQKAQEVCETRGWTGLGASDAHQVSVIGCCYTSFDYNIRDPRDLVEAIRSRSATALER